MATSPPHGDPSTDELLVHARQGDRAALEHLLARVAPAVHRFGVRMCKSAHDADDVLQDTLIAVARHLGDFEGRSSLTSWVFTLARTACSRKRRGLANKPHETDTALADAAAPLPSPEAQAESHELGRALGQALDHLTDEHREVILLRDVEGLSAPEAAEAVGISEGALKSRLHRAREALREALRPLLEPARPAAPGGCPDIVALWSQKLEGDLRQHDCSAMERHLEGCPSCAAACDALKGALVACRRVRDGEVPPEIQARVKAALRALT